MLVIVESIVHSNTLWVKNENHEEGKLPRTWNQSQMCKLEYVLRLCHVEMICGPYDTLWKED